MDAAAGLNSRRSSTYHFSICKESGHETLLRAQQRRNFQCAFEDAEAWEDQAVLMFVDSNIISVIHAISSHGKR
eukprot:6922064-Pyramimonas_sp.AAC.1